MSAFFINSNGFVHVDWNVKPANVKIFKKGFNFARKWSQLAESSIVNTGF